MVRRDRIGQGFVGQREAVTQHVRRDVGDVLGPNIIASAQDVTDIAPDVLRHRLALSYEALSDAITPDHLVRRLMRHLPAPDKLLDSHVNLHANA